jgi:chromosomal replication initiation ATPase DnaA
MPTAREIIASVAERHGLASSDVISPRRTRPIVRAKQEAIREIRAAFPRASLTWIATQMRMRSHATVMYHLDS